jgi:solute carrier family 25 oxoglutarate transporter 11
MEKKKVAQSESVLTKFVFGGVAGVMAWVIVHPANTLATRMNLLQSAQGEKRLGVISFGKQIVAKEGWTALYKGLSAGIVRQLFYATSRIGLYDVFRDFSLKFREVDIFSRLACGIISGGCAAMISCPAEVTLVRMSNDNSLPPDQRRNYTSIFNAAFRIIKDEGLLAYWRGCMPFVNRAMLVGAFQVGTNDQFKQFYKTMLPREKVLIFSPEFLNTVCSSVSAGFIYSFITMPFETAKNRMAFQKPDPVTGKLPYRGTLQTIGKVARTGGLSSLWFGYWPYFARCGGHTVAMFVFLDWLKNMYANARLNNSNSV